MLTAQMNPEDITNETSQTGKENIARFHLYQVPRVFKLIETERRTVVAKDCETRESSCYLTGAVFQICKIKHGWGCLVVTVAQ